MRSKVRNLALILLIPAVWACGPGDSPEPREATVPVAAPVSRRPAAPAAASAKPARAQAPLVIFLGDSLTAGLGLEAAEAYPALVEQDLHRQGHPVRVLNAGVSGDTTAGGLSRLPWLLKQKPDVLVVGLGANDGLRGQPIEEIEKNLREIVRRGKQAGARVLLLGMEIPPNYGGDYAGRFAAIYPRIAKDLDVPLVPFLLEGVGGVPELNLGDGMHPNVRGQVKVAANVEPYLVRVLTAGSVAR
jgi:acyl-CoA thioesterase-1